MTYERRLCTQIYFVLIILTLVSVGVYTLHLMRYAAILVALGIAWVKAGLIGYHYMRLKTERPLVWAVLFIAMLAVVILGIGVIPDLAGRYP